MEIGSGTFESVPRLFEKLVAQLPASIFLFVVVDGSSFYEDAARLDEMREVMERLARLGSEDDGIGPVFKRLLSSPTRIRHLLGVEKEEVLNVPREVPPQSGLNVLRNGKVRQEAN